MAAAAKPKPPPPAHLSPSAQSVWAEMATGRESPTQLITLEALAVQIARMRDAQKRIDEEGLVVADVKGEPIPHPALAIERAAHEQIRRWAAVRRRPGG